MKPTTIGIVKGGAYRSVRAEKSKRSEPMSYELILEKRPTYLHAKVVGDRTPANVLRFLEEAHAACEQSGYSALLLEMRLSGPSLNTTAILDVISQMAPVGRKLSRIAFVHPIMDDPAMPHFAELAARNRGVNIRLFLTVDAATLWLSGANLPSSL